MNKHYKAYIYHSYCRSEEEKMDVNEEEGCDDGEGEMHVKRE